MSEEIFAKSNPEDFGETAGLVDPEIFPQWIIFEDENFLVLNKPGWTGLFHPDRENKKVRPAEHTHKSCVWI